MESTDEQTTTPNKPTTRWPLSVALALLGLLGGPLLILIGIGLSGFENDVQQHGTETSGSIVRKTYSSARHTTYYFTVRWHELANQSEHLIKLEVPIAEYNSANVNDSVPIVYLPTNPGDARIKGEQQNWFLHIAWVYGGTIILISCVSRLYHFWRTSRPKKPTG